MAVLGGLAAARYLPLLDETRALRASLERLATRAGQLGLNLDRGGLAELTAGLNDARSRFDRLAIVAETDPLVGVLRGFGPFNGQVRGADSLIAAGREMLDAGDEATAVAARYVAIREVQSTDPAGHSTMADLVALMAGSRDAVSRAQSHVNSARALVATVPDGLWGPLDGARDLMIEKLGQYAPALDTFAEIDDVLPGMMGWGDRKRYLVLAQNPAELRPTGGFAGTYGIVAFQDGRIVERKFEDAVAFDTRFRHHVAYVEPPAGLKGHLLGNFSWELADANWSPDFPTAARDALRLYTHESGDRDIDGVIAITTYAMDELLSVTGPITVPEYAVTVAAGETTLKALQNTRVSARPGENRKAFLDVFAAKVLDSLFSLRPSAWQSLLGRLEVIAGERRAVAWFADPTAQALAANAGWSGAVRQDEGDYVYAVDANVGPVSKLNLVTDRAQTLDVRLDEFGNADDRLELTWTNGINEAKGLPLRRLAGTGGVGSLNILGTYTRVMAAARSRLESVEGGSIVQLTGAEVVAEEAGRAVFGSYIMVPPGSTSVTFRWISPYAADLTDGIGTYRLVVQRQPGTRGEPLEVRIQVPDGSSIIDATPGLDVTGTIATLRTTLLEDVSLTVKYRSGSP